MKTFEFKIWGIVQGVGFRPFLSKVARKNKLQGWVINEGGYVSATVSGLQEQLENFISDLKLKKPGPAEIVHMEIKEIPFEAFKGFKIKESSHGNDGIVMLPADISICPTCLKEMQSPNNIRYRHPFISCMECGPRYSIIDRVPYDRHNTVMIDFPMCDFCSGEYRDPDDRRYHAQTISCHDCGPYLKYQEIVCENQGKNYLEKEDALNQSISELKKGKILAIKGIGGFHLACRPDITDSVKAMRELKGREEKPFAVMFENITELKKFCIVSDLEETALKSKEKPIVLLELKQDGRDYFSPEVSKSSSLLGAFLPYTPLHHLILKETGPLIMTSANLADDPIIIEDEEIFRIKGKELHGVLYNDRRIRTGEDDSVVRVIGDKLRVGRRARGYVPIPIFMDSIAKNRTDITEGYKILATGGDLKNTFCLSKGAFAYPSQHFGDLNDFAISQIYENNVVRMQEMLRIEPELVVCDMHPGYATNSFADRYSKEKGIETMEVQHHHSHVASVMAEHGLEGKVLGIAYDGTGFGTDQKIWGSEFLLCEQGEFERFGHLEYVRMIGGDSSTKDAWKSAFSYGHKYGLAFTDLVREDSSITEKQWELVTKALDLGINSIDNSSMGRLFDAVSFLLGLCTRSLYEGDAAIRLENMAKEYLELPDFKKNGSMTNSPEHFSFEVRKCGSCYEINAEKIIKELLHELNVDTSDSNNSRVDRIKKLSWKFHCTIAKLSLDMAILCREETGVNQIALSGGVFQNRLLFELLEKELIAEKFAVYSNEKVPVNDGGISLGQIFIGNCRRILCV